MQNLWIEETRKEVNVPVKSLACLSGSEDMDFYYD